MDEVLKVILSSIVLLFTWILSSGILLFFKLDLEVVQLIFVSSDYSYCQDPHQIS